MLVRDALERISRGVTTIVIAHRLSTILNADRVYFLEAGQVVEEGRLPDLLARSGRWSMRRSGRCGGWRRIEAMRRGGRPEARGAMARPGPPGPGFPTPAGCAKPRAAPGRAPGHEDGLR